MRYSISCDLLVLSSHPLIYLSILLKIMNFALKKGILCFPLECFTSRSICIQFFFLQFSQIFEEEFTQLSQEASHVISVGDDLIQKLNSQNDDRGHTLKTTAQAVLRNLWSQYLISIQVGIRRNYLC